MLTSHDVTMFSGTILLFLDYADSQWRSFVLCCDHFGSECYVTQGFANFAYDCGPSYASLFRWISANIMIFIEILFAWPIRFLSIRNASGTRNKIE